MYVILGPNFCHAFKGVLQIMVEMAKELVPVNIEDELKQSYLDYAMSVIVGRALPEVRDGLKPVHRRALFAMHELGNDWNKSYKKSARIVGDVIGKYHPHGDTAVYDTIVRMAQPFSMRYMLVDGQGNFGSIDGDSPAAMRYTEIRMSKIAHSLLADLEKDTVDFAPNYDETEFAPVVFPSRVPNLLVNGSSGIAVGMATNIPPHNLTEVIDACIAFIDKPQMDVDEIMEFIPGPDFPTAGIINGRAGIVEAYKTGRGKIYVRAKTQFETDASNKTAIIVNEMPYQVNKARLIEKIAELVKDKKVEGITALRDESDKDGIRVVIELRRGEVPEVVLNKLYTYTQMQTVFGINMVALVEGQPRLLNIKQIIEYFIRHRREVVVRRTLFELRKARQRAHLLEGLGIALANIDVMISLIKSSQSPLEAKKALLAQSWPIGMVKDMLQKAGSDACRPEDLPENIGIQKDGSYYLSTQQAQAILDLKLHRLTALEQDKILGEFAKLIDLISELLEILGSSTRLMEVIRDELIDIKAQFADARRTEILAAKEDLTLEDLITEEEVAVTLSHLGYVKYQPLDVYKAQRRGGKGKAATNVKEEDFVSRLIIANTHDTLLCFSNHGKLYWLKAYQLPLASRISRGKPIVNILPLAKDEFINAMLPVKEFLENHFVFMATRKGTVKKVPLTAFSRPRANGIIAVDLVTDDFLIGVGLTDGSKDIMLFSDIGKVVRFSEDKVRAMGRTARGVRGIRLTKAQHVISMVVVDDENATILTATKNGYGKRTDINEYRQSNRGGQGVISIQVNERNGNVIRAIQVKDSDETMMITDKGTLVRFKTSELSIIGRNTQGVRLINVSDNEKVVGLQKVEEVESDEVESEEVDSENETQN